MVITFGKATGATTAQYSMGDAFTMMDGFIAVPRRMEYLMVMAPATFQTAVSSSKDSGKMAASNANE